MDIAAQRKALRDLLGEARQLASDGDPLLSGLYAALVARIEMLLSLLDVEAESES